VTQRAVILVSGGLDSATTLAIAKQRGIECYALSVDYGQRHASELIAAKNVVIHIGVKEHKLLHIDLTQIGGSALTDVSIDVPTQASDGIPVTYVPARNTLFLSLALGWAEVVSAEFLFIGVNAVDYSGYPDCRIEYISAFEQMANLATKRAIEGQPIKIETPLIKLSKQEIIRKGLDLGVDFSITVSCYAADEQARACGVCDACRIRADGFRQAGVADPTIYQ
jgi:7-cyano-7-deazaguanine synthase